MLSGSKRCIVLHPLTEESKKVGGGGGGAISIPVSMLWTYPCPLLFYQIKKDSNCLFSDSRDFNYNLSRRLCS